MKKLKAWMTEHKKFSVIALCLLLQVHETEDACGNPLHLSG